MEYSIKKITHNISWIVTCKVIQSLLALIVGSLTARFLGPANYGTINYASSLVGFVTPIMFLGMTSILVNEFIKKPEDEGKTLGTATVMCLCSSVLCIAAVTAFSFFANKNETETILVTFLYSVVLIFQAVEIVQYWFQAKLKSKYASIVMLAAYVTVSIYRIILLVLEKNIYWFAVANAFDYLLIAVILLLIYKNLGGHRLEFSWEKAKHLWSQSRFFIISSLMITIFTQTDKIMLKVMLDETATGLYSAASTCIFLTNFVFVAIYDSLRPSVLLGKKSDTKEAYEKKVVFLFSVINILSILQCVFITVFSELIILILFGRDYMAAVGVLRIVVWYTFFSYIGMSRSIWILAEEKQKHLWKINLCGASANVLLNLLLIPEYGITGAAAASLLTQFFTNIVVPQFIPDIRYSNRLLLKSFDLINSARMIKKVIRGYND